MWTEGDFRDAAQTSDASLDKGLFSNTGTLCKGSFAVWPGDINESGLGINGFELPLKHFHRMCPGSNGT